MLLRHQANPGGEVTARSESPWVSDIRHQSGCQQRAATGNVVKPPARFIRPVPGHDHSIEFQNLLLEAEQLSAQCGKTCTHDVRYPFVVSVGNDMEQFLDTFTSNRCDDAEFGKVSPDRIDDSRLLADA